MAGDPLLQDRVELGVVIGCHLKVARCAAPRALLLARCVVAGLIHGQALLRDDIAGDLEGQPQRVVQEEGLVARNWVPPAALVSAMISSSRAKP